MKKSELKKILKPIIKECIHETLIKEGLLSSIISEIVSGLGTPQQPILEQKQNNKDNIKQMQLEERQRRSQKVNDTRKKMLDAINRDAYNGVDLFEGTVPMSKAGSPGDEVDSQGPLSGVAPGDSGVDLSSLMGNASTWKALVKG